MNAYLSPFLLLALSATDGAGEPSLTYMELAPIPVDACEGALRTCAVTAHFVVQPSGEVSDVVLAKSSGYRACDETVARSVKKWRYTKSVAPSKETVTFKPYTCPLR